MEFKSDLPYPKIRVERQNINYATKLLNDYAGYVSELSAIHLYSYQSFVSDKYREYKDIIMKIAEVEMIHLRLLGETIYLLGGVPVFGGVSEDKILRLWNSGEIIYNRDLKTMLKSDIESEEMAIKNYNDNLREIDDKYVKELIERILIDEEIHLTIFRNLYKKYF